MFGRLNDLPPPTPKARKAQLPQKLATLLLADVFGNLTALYKVPAK